jgi:hypothetical protein
VLPVAPVMRKRSSLNMIGISIFLVVLGREAHFIFRSLRVKD